MSSIWQNEVYTIPSSADSQILNFYKTRILILLEKQLLLNPLQFPALKYYPFNSLKSEPSSVFPLSHNSKYIYNYNHVLFNFTTPVSKFSS